MIALVDCLFFLNFLCFLLIELYTYGPFSHGFYVPVSRVGRKNIPTPATSPFTLCLTSGFIGQRYVSRYASFNVLADSVLVSCAFSTRHEKTMPWIASGPRMKHCNMNDTWPVAEHPLPSLWATHELANESQDYK